MLGAIIGDVVGSVYEWNNIKTKDFPLFGKRNFFTDDSVMTIAVADALLTGGTQENFIDSMKKIGRIYPNSGYGGSFNSWIFSDDRAPYNSWGNGSAMRVSPCGWYANSLEEVEKLASLSASVTHNHPEGIKGAKATAAAIYLARTGKSKDDIRRYIEDKFGYDLSRTLEAIRPVYRFNESCQETVPEAIIAFLESTGFEDAIRNAISLGGDSDTLAAITGSIAEAAYGIPNEILTAVFFFLDDTLASVINAWIDNGKPLNSIVKKPDWDTEAFSKTHTIKTDICFSEKQYARIRLGLLPTQMEEKWFIYYENSRLHFHRSWTGYKIYEAEIRKRDSDYVITEIIVERNTEIYSNANDSEDVLSFNYLLACGLLGLDVEIPINNDNPAMVLKAWSNFGNMIL